MDAALHKRKSSSEWREIAINCRIQASFSFDTANKNRSIPTPSERRFPNIPLHPIPLKG
jgi:hypothetical protein